MKTFFLTWKKKADLFLLFPHFHSWRKRGPWKDYPGKSFPHGSLFVNTGEKTVQIRMRKRTTRKKKHSFFPLRASVKRS